MEEIYNKIEKKFPTIMLFIVAIFSYLLLLLMSQDNDMFFEIMSGRDILHGNFTTVSHLDNHPMIVQQWLYTVFLALFDKMGYSGDMIFVLLQDIILVAVASIFIYRHTKNVNKAIIGSSLALLLNYNYMINIRPQIITMILIIIELIFIDIYKEKNSVLYLWCNIPILILAANFHQAVFLYHLFILIPYYYDRTKEDKNKKKKKNKEQDNDEEEKEIIKLDWKLILFTPLYLLCSLCTPYGIKGALYIVNTFKSHAYDYYSVMEIESISRFPILCGVVVVTLLYTIWCIYKQKSNKYVNFYAITITLLCLCTSVRHFSIFFLVCVYFLRYVELPNNKYVKMCFTLFLIFTLMQVHPTIRDLKNTYINDVQNYIPSKDAKIYNVDVNIGGWLEYNGYTKVKIDLRTEAFTKEITNDENTLKDIYALRMGYYKDGKEVDFVNDDYLFSIINGYDYVITQKQDYVNRILNKDYTVVYKDTNHYIWRKN